jgi:hypothetical protein
MGIIDALASAFINTFGITQPTEETRRKASWFILGMMVLVLAVITAGAAVVFRVLRH